MTEQSSDMVGRVARILRRSRELNMSSDDANRLARSVLEVSHHAELVEAIRAAKRLIENINEFGNVTDIEFVDEADSRIGSALALIGNDV